MSGSACPPRRPACAFDCAADALAHLREAERFITVSNPGRIRLYRLAVQGLAALCDHLLAAELPPVRRRAG